MASGASSGRQVEYLLIASGKLAYAPYLLGWREFKDYIRQRVKGQPSWTDVSKGVLQDESEGWTSFKDWDDAYIIYGMVLNLSRS